MKRINRVLVKSIVAIVLPLMLFASIVGVAGNKAFSDAMQVQYASSACRMADAAALEVDPDRMDAYLASGGESEEYRAVWDRLDQLCNALGVTFIYVIQPDLTDYGHITFVFSTVNADFSEYSPYEAGPCITKEEFPVLVEQGVVSGGMLPKLENAFGAIRAGVHEVVITCTDALDLPAEGTRLH